MRKLGLSLALISTLGLAGCADPYNPLDRAGTGALLGAGGGAAIGASIAGGQGAATGALIGGAVGALTGLATTPARPHYHYRHAYRHEGYGYYR